DGPGSRLTHDLDLVLVDDVALVADPDLGRRLRSRGDRDQARRESEKDATGQRLQLLPLVAQERAAVLAELGPVRVPVPALRALDHGDSPPLAGPLPTPGPSLIGRTDGKGVRDSLSRKLSGNAGAPEVKMLT